PSWQGTTVQISFRKRPERGQALFKIGVPTLDRTGGSAHEILQHHESTAPDFSARRIPTGGGKDKSGTARARIRQLGPFRGDVVLPSWRCAVFKRDKRR